MSLLFLVLVFAHLPHGRRRHGRRRRPVPPASCPPGRDGRGRVCIVSLAAAGERRRLCANPRTGGSIWCRGTLCVCARARVRACVCVCVCARVSLSHSLCVGEGTGCRGTASCGRPSFLPPPFARRQDKTAAAAMCVYICVCVYMYLHVYTCISMYTSI